VAPAHNLDPGQKETIGEKEGGGDQSKVFESRAVPPKPTFSNCKKRNFVKVVRKKEKKKMRGGGGRTKGYSRQPYGFAELLWGPNSLTNRRNLNKWGQEKFVTKRRKKKGGLSGLLPMKEGPPYEVSWLQKRGEGKGKEKGMVGLDRCC